jgi:undecaprenyl diphosphate synthase
MQSKVPIMQSYRNQKSKAPYHVALIPDGNRRWARQHRLDFFHGYDLGVKKFIKFSIWAKNMGIKVLTVWALSTENVRNRDNRELGVLYKIYIKAAKDKSILKMLKDNDTRINIIGDLALIPASVRKALYSLQNKTKSFRSFTINLLIGYGGRDDLLHALGGVPRHGKRLGEDAIAKHLITSKVPDVDLVIRTSGEMRLSGLLPWQTCYSELYFAKKYWPDFGRSDLQSAVSEYGKRERRFGK